MEELKIVLVIALVVAFVALIMGFMALSKAKKALEKTDKERIRKYSKDVFDQQIDFYFNQKVKKMIREEFVRQHTLLVSTSKPKETAAPKEKKAEPQPVKKELEPLVKQVSEQPKENNDTSGEEAYNVIQMENMFKSGTTWMKQQILQLLDDRMTSNLANEGNSAGGRYYSAKMEEDNEIITKVKKL